MGKRRDYSNKFGAKEPSKKQRQAMREAIKAAKRAMRWISFEHGGAQMWALVDWDMFESHQRAKRWRGKAPVRLADFFDGAWAKHSDGRIVETNFMPVEMAVFEEAHAMNLGLDLERMCEKVASGNRQGRL